MSIRSKERDPPEVAPQLLLREVLQRLLEYRVTLELVNKSWETLSLLS